MVRVDLEESGAYTAAKRANGVERQRLEREWGALEREFRHARRAIVERREDAREELRRLRLESKAHLQQADSCVRNQRPGDTGGTGRVVKDNGVVNGSLEKAGSGRSSSSSVGSSTSRSAENTAELQIQKATGGIQDENHRFADKSRHVRRHYGDLVTAIVHRPAAPAPHKEPTNTETTLNKLPKVPSAVSAQHNTLPPHKRGPKISDKTPTVSKKRKRPKEKKNNSVAEKKSGSGGGSNLVVSLPTPAPATLEEGVQEEKPCAKSLLKKPDQPTRRGSLQLEPLVSPTTTPRSEGAKSPRHVKFDIADPSEDIAPLNRMWRRRSLQGDSLMIPSIKHNITINIIHEDQTPNDAVGSARLKPAKNDVDDVSTSGDAHQRLVSRRRSEPALLDVNALQLRSRSPNSSTGDAAPAAYAGVSLPQGWRKVKNLLGAIGDQSPALSGAGHVQGRMARRASASVQLLLLLDKVNASRTTAELLEMDSARRKLAEGQLP